MPSEGLMESPESRNRPQRFMRVVKARTPRRIFWCGAWRTCMGTDSLLQPTDLPSNPIWFFR